MQELNERERPRKIGTYRFGQKTYDKFKDEENYIFINVGGTSITIEGDGEKKSQSEIAKEIKDALSESKLIESFEEFKGLNEASGFADEKDWKKWIKTDLRIEANHISIDDDNSVHFVMSSGPIFYYTGLHSLMKRGKFKDVSFHLWNDELEIKLIAG